MFAAHQYTLPFVDFFLQMGESIILNKCVILHIIRATRILNFVRRLFPEWRVNSEFINEHLNQALRLDARPSSHPIEVAVPDANQINQVSEECTCSACDTQLTFPLVDI